MIEPNLDNMQLLGICKTAIHYDCFFREIDTNKNFLLSGYTKKLLIRGCETTPWSIAVIFDLKEFKHELPAFNMHLKSEILDEVRIESSKPFARALPANKEQDVLVRVYNKNKEKLIEADFMQGDSVCPEGVFDVKEQYFIFDEKLTNCSIFHDVHLHDEINYYEDYLSRRTSSTKQLCDKKYWLKSIVIKALGFIRNIIHLIDEKYLERWCKEYH